MTASTELHRRADRFTPNRPDTRHVYLDVSVVVVSCLPDRQHTNVDNLYCQRLQRMAVAVALCACVTFSYLRDQHELNFSAIHSSALHCPSNYKSLIWIVKCQQTV